MTTPTQRDLFERAKALTARAATKYGPTATSPKGDERYDVFDFALNELAGIERYVEMMLNRMGDYPNLPPGARNRLVIMVQKINHEALALAFIRAELLEAGCELGDPEKI